MNVYDRMMCIQLLPQKGSRSIHRIVDDHLKRLSLSEEEVKEFEYEIDIDKGTSKWNEKGREQKPIEISDTMKDIIIKKLKELDKKEEIGRAIVPVYDLFIKEE